VSVVSAAVRRCRGGSLHQRAGGRLQEPPALYRSSSGCKWLSRVHALLDRKDVDVLGIPSKEFM
jgi:hypothetical protein